MGQGPVGVKIPLSGVSIVAAGVPAGQMAAFIRSPLRKSSATQVKFSCKSGRSFAHDGRQTTPAATNTMFRHVAAF